MRIVHLSDFHLSKDNLKDTETFILKALIKDMELFNNDKKIDLILHSGDLIDKGGVSYGNIDDALLDFTFKIIDPICSSLNLHRGRFLFVPGNHDIDKSLDSEIIETGLAKTLINTDSVNKYMDSRNKEGIKRIEPFKTFEEIYYSEYIEGKYDFTDFQSNCKIIIDNISVGITCFNTAWRSYNSETDSNKLILGERQITNSLEIIQDCDIKIGVIHHQLDMLANFEREIVESMITKEYDMLFSGHVHKGSSWKKSFLNNDLFYSVAPSNRSLNIRNRDIDHTNGYSVIDYNHINKSIVVHHRKYSYIKQEYVSNNDFGDNQGKEYYQFPSQEELVEHNLRKEIFNHIKSSYYSEINSHLLSFNTDTRAPKNINDLFVLPKITLKKQYDSSKESEEITYDVELLCNTNENLLIMGNKESGKTILLDKILLELLNNQEIYLKIPVYFSFRELRTTNRIESLISRFLGIGIHNVKTTLTKNKVLLLIDDISFLQSDKYTLKKIEVFSKEYPTINIIVTSNSGIEKELLINEDDFPTIFSLITLKLEELRTREIKILIKKWFSYDTSDDINIRLEKISNILVSLNIPRTPFAVSMFLWIFEQQENYKPVNNATMLENFIERLFKKHSDKEIYSEIFDYRNKERLLAEIAYKMYEVNDVNYRIYFEDLRDFIRDYLKIKKFDFKVDNVIKEFFDVGIFIYELIINVDYVRFRFSSFFNYFLMKNMDFKKEFKKYILSDENFIYFEEEVDYYTGINRDETEILSLIVRKMNETYSEILEEIKKGENSFDNFFETTTSITSKFDNSFVKKISSNKISEEKKEEINDNLLESVKPNTIISKKEEEISSLERLWRYWTLSARILKNTEETEIADFKNKSLESILECSMAFTSIYKYLLINALSKKGMDKENHERLNIQCKILPVIHQLELYSLVGSKKLNIVIQEEINKKINDKTISELEKFLLVFLYADLHGEGYIKYINELLKISKKKYILDMIFLKVVMYYHLRSNSKDLDTAFENLIADCIIKAKRLDNSKKALLIQEYKNKRKEKLSNEELVEA